MVAVQPARTFRVFVSSTFRDLKAERDALGERVFPDLRHLCAERGARFHAVDLRWGVSQAAARAQQTMALCLKEISRCEIFLVLLGDRYGWRPLPASIESSDFERIMATLGDGSARKLLEQWYRLDRNAVPPARYLRTRPARSSSETEQTHRPVDEQGTVEPWAVTEDRLRSVLERAGNELTPGLDPQVSCRVSATEQEIDGALAGAGGRHVLCFFRSIEGLPLEPEAQRFADLDGNSQRNAWARVRLAELKAKLRDCRPGGIFEYSARWQDGGPSPDHLEALCRDAYQSLERIILQELTQLEDVDPLDREIAAHRRFAGELTREYVDPPAPLEAIRRYLEADDRRPLVIHGPPGSGKSALMARALERARSSASRDYSEAEIVSRFIGVTPGSSNARQLLASLSRQIRAAYGADTESFQVDYRELEESFPQELAVARVDRPLWLFLDALDQLRGADPGRSLAWLPAKLPVGVKLVVTTLPNETLTAIEARGPSRFSVALEPMPRSDASVLLDRWLAAVGRILAPDQKSAVLAGFSVCPRPLYLKLAFEEARHWYFDEPAIRLARDIRGLIARLFDKLSEEARHGEALVARSLGYLAASKHGLTEDELLDVLSDDERVMTDFDRRRSPASPEVARVPPVIWSRLYFDLEPYLTERSADGASVVTFYHREFAEAATARYLAADCKEQRHRSLAAFFRKQPVRAERGRRANLRRLSELPYHQALGRLDLTPILGDFSFLFTKLRAVGPAELIDDFALAPIDAEGLRLVGEALRLSAHILTQDADQLAHQLIARLGAEEVTEVVALLEQARQEHSAPWLRPLNACLWSPKKPLLRTLHGHVGQITSVVVAPDRRTVISGSADRSIRLWDIDRGMELAVLSGHRDRVSALAVSQDGRWLASGSADGAVRVWDLATRRPEATLCGDQAEVLSVAFGPNGRWLVSGSADKAVTVWDLDRKAVLTRMTDHEGGVSAVSITPDGRRVVSGSQDSRIKVWDLEAREELSTLVGHTDGVTCLALPGDARLLVSGSADRTVNVWNLASGAELTTLAGPTREISGIAVTSDPCRAVAGSLDGTIRIWSLQDVRPDDGTEARFQPDRWRRSGFTELGERRLRRELLEDRGELPEGAPPLATVEGSGEPIRAIALSPSRRLAVSGSDDATVRIWDLDRAEEKAAPVVEASRIQSVAISEDGRRAVVGTRIGELRIWNLDDGVESHKMAEHDSAIHVVTVTAGGRWAISGAADGWVRLWDLDRGHEVDSFSAHDGSVEAVAATPDGRRAVSASADRTLQTWDLETGRRLAVLEGHEQEVTAVAASADGRHALSGSRDGSLRLWDLETGVGVRTFSGHAGAVSAVALTPDGRHAVSGSWDRSVRLWRLADGRLMRLLGEHGSAVRRVAVTSDGRRVIPLTGDPVLGVWDLEKGSKLFELDLPLDFPTGEATAVGDEGQPLEIADVPISTAVTGNGSWAVTASGGHVHLRDGSSVAIAGVLRLWDLRRRVLVALFRGDVGYETCAISADGKRIVAADATGRIHVLGVEGLCSAPRPKTTPAVHWRPTTDAWRKRSACRCRVKGHAGRVGAVAITTDGRRAITGSWDSTVCIWDVVTGSRLRTLAGHDEAIVMVAVTDSGRTALSVSRDARVRAWRLRDYSLERRRKSGSPSLLVALAPMGQRAISVHQGLLRLWDLEDNRELWTAPAKTNGEVEKMVITPDGRWAALASRSRRVVVWDLSGPRGQNEIWSIECARPLRSLAITPDGRVALCGFDDGTVRAWEVPTQTECHGPARHDAAVDQLSTSSDGRWALAGSSDATLRVWRLGSGGPIAELEGPPDASACALSVTPARATVVAGDDAGNVHFLPLENPLPSIALRDQLRPSRSRLE